MSTESLTCKDMLEPLERLMERRAPAGRTVFSTDQPPPSGAEARLDMLHIAGDRQALHLLRIVERFDTCLFDMDHGILSLGDVAANFVWIALPLEEFRDGEQAYRSILQDTCEERGIGIAVVQTRGKGLSAKSMVEPGARAGNFMKHHAGLEEKWRENTRGFLVGDDYRVVEYYNR